MKTPTTEQIRERHDTEIGFRTADDIDNVWYDKWKECDQHRGLLLKRLEAAEAKLALMKPYLKHNTPKVHCDFMKHSDYPCTCGLDAILESKPIDAKE